MGPRLLSKVYRKAAKQASKPRPCGICGKTVHMGIFQRFCRKCREIATKYDHHMAI